ncbi:MAG: glycogen synthase GlgA [Candidatus Omnitrophica bacterium]|nr:glycogen synthase GlgA [Candidatus Omnitrophota bacterium]
MKIAFVSSEMVPFAKTGGLADVSGSLPLGLEKYGSEVKVFMPKYKTVKVVKNQTVIGKGIDVFFIENEKYFNRENLYGDRSGDYPDNLERFAYFSKAVLETLKKTGFKPDIVHCNDWQSALIPVYLKTIYKDNPFFANTKTVLTIHNLAYQGLFDKSLFPQTGLDWELFSIDGFEFYGKVNVLKAGIEFTDFINTVSPTYAGEIQTKEFGYGLEGVLQKRSDALFGILNGIDYDVWNPATDKNIAKNYDASSSDQKYLNKEDLQRSSGLTVDKNVPLIGIISRLADQKGLDLIADIIEKILKLKVQFILLGAGDDRYHVLFDGIAKKYPKITSINLKFDAVLAQKIYAGCDMFLMPSRFEPCGLGQMICLRYGTVPIVRTTGGLKDTISEYNESTKQGNGFTFLDYSSAKLFDTIKRALSLYKKKAAWLELVKRAMGYDFSLEHSAKEYLALYAKLASKKSARNHAGCVAK